MQKVLDKRDTFIVRSSKSPSGSDTSPTMTVVLPSGQRVHSLDRSVLERAIKAAAKVLREKEQA